MVMWGAKFFTWDFTGAFFGMRLDTREIISLVFAKYRFSAPHIVLSVLKILLNALLILAISSVRR